MFSNGPYTNIFWCKPLLSSNHQKYSVLDGQLIPLSSWEYVTCSFGPCHCLAQVLEAGRDWLAALEQSCKNQPSSVALLQGWMMMWLIRMCQCYTALEKYHSQTLLHRQLIPWVWLQWETVELQAWERSNEEWVDLGSVSPAWQPL